MNARERYDRIRALIDSGGLVVPAIMTTAALDLLTNRPELRSVLSHDDVEAAIGAALLAHARDEQRRNAAAGELL